jgi:hypothetical protein
LETDFDLPQKYADLGFELSKVGEQSIALRCRDNLVFIFTSGIDAREGFVSRLCDCHMKHTANDKPNSRN